MYKEGVVYVYNRYYSDIKKNEIMPFAATWMDLEIMLLSEVSQKEKDKYHIISLICGIENRTQKQKTHRKRNQTCGYQRWRVGEGELEERGQKVQTSSYKINKY